MSGEGVMAAGGGDADPRNIALTEAIVRERAGVLAHARATVRGLERWQRRGAFDAEQQSIVARILLNFADDIAIGLHVEGEASPELRARMRALVNGGRAPSIEEKTHD